MRERVGFKMKWRDVKVNVGGCCVSGEKEVPPVKMLRHRGEIYATGENLVAPGRMLCEVGKCCAGGEFFLEWYSTWQEKLVPLC